MRPLGTQKRVAHASVSRVIFPRHAIARFPWEISFSFVQSRRGHLFRPRHHFDRYVWKGNPMVFPTTYLISCQRHACGPNNQSTTYFFAKTGNA